MDKHRRKEPRKPESPSEFQNALIRILDAAIAVDNAVKGNIQLFDPAMGGLRIVTQRGFDPAFLETFEGRAGR